MEQTPQSGNEHLSNELKAFVQTVEQFQSLPNAQQNLEGLKTIYTPSAACKLSAKAILKIIKDNSETPSQDVAQKILEKERTKMRVLAVVAAPGIVVFTVVVAANSVVDHIISRFPRSKEEEQSK